MSDFFKDALGAVSGAEWEEIPVTIEEFVTSEKFLNLPPLSEYQYQMIKAMSQIYREDTLIALYGDKAGEARYKQTCTEVVLQLGKGSGKDYCSTIACCYVVYLLLCLKAPAEYYGKPRGDAIDIVNVAINAEQAKNVFFKGLREKVEQCPWFIGKYEVKNTSIEFSKSVTVYSGHSQREAFEGLNLFMAILDEISGFALESNTGNDLADTADATYNMYRASVDSRFPDFGKVILLSFSRFAGDYIQQRYGPEYNDISKGMIGVVAEKEIVMRSHTFKIDEDLPDGINGNEFTIEWEEDHITRYSFPKLFALRRPTWEVNPTRSIEDFKRAFYTNRADALGRFACMPSTNTDDTFFKNKKMIEDSFSNTNGVDFNGVFHPHFKPKFDTEYYLHVDLSKVHDRCAIAMAHVESWKLSGNGGTQSYNLPHVIVDAVRWWKPSKENPMDYREVVQYILELKRREFNIKLVTFDRWSSHDTMNYLEQHHIKTETLSVANKHYDDFLSVLYDERLQGPNIPELLEELKMLRYIKGKVDHPRSGYKDLSDAVCGAIFNAVSYSRKPVNQVVETITLADLKKAEAERRESALKAQGIIIAPKRSDLPKDMDQYIISKNPLRII